MRSTIGTDSSPIVITIHSKKWKRHLHLHTMLNMFSPNDMLKFFVEGESEDEPSLGEQKFSKGVEEEKN
jgi:hypothetical protein